MQDYILELPAFNPTRKFFNQFWTIKQPNFSWFTCFSLVILGVLGKYIWVNHWIFCKIWGGMPKLCWIFFLWWLPSASAVRQVVRITEHVHTCAVTYLEITTFWQSNATTYFLLNRDGSRQNLSSTGSKTGSWFATASYANAIQLRWYLEVGGNTC